MIRRCYNARYREYRWYGAKGIGVCDEWKADCSEFCEWSLANGYADSLTIDRKDGRLGYFPGNCRWATRQQQRFNMPKATRATSSVFKGVSRDHGRPKWGAKIKRPSDDCVEHIGTFNTELEAALAYDLKAVELHGEFACVNFPERFMKQGTRNHSRMRAKGVRR